MDAEKVQPAVEMELGGKLRKLIFSVNAACLIEQELGREILSGAFFKGMGFRELRATLYGMMYWQDKTLTLDQVGCLMQFDKFPEYFKSILEAYQRAMPEAKTEAEAKNA